MFDKVELESTEGNKEKRKSGDLSEFQMLAKLNFPHAKVKASGIKWVLDGTPNERGAAFGETSFGGAELGDFGAMSFQFTSC